MRYFLLLNILLILSLKSFSQDDQTKDFKSKNFALGITSGFGSMVVRDQVFTTFLYKANYIPFGLHFESKKPNQKAYFNLEFFNRPKFKTETNAGFEYKGDLGEFYPSEKDGLSISTLKSSFWNFNYSQLFLLQKTKEKKIKAFLGFDLNLLRFEKQFLQFESVNRLTDRIYNLGFLINLERNFTDRHLIMYNLSVPVISNVKRTLYNSDSNPGTVAQTKYGFFSKSYGFDSRITYQFMISPKFSIRAIYAFRYMQITFPSKEEWAYNQGDLGLFFHF